MNDFYFDYVLESITDSYIAYEGQTAKAIGIDFRTLIGREGREFYKYLRQGYSAELHKDYKNAINNYTKARSVISKLIHELLTYPGDLPDSICGTILEILSTGGISGLIGAEIGSKINTQLFYVKDREELKNYNPTARDTLHRLYQWKWWLNRRITKCNYKMKHKKRR